MPLTNLKRTSNSCIRNRYSLLAALSSHCPFQNRTNWFSFPIMKKDWRCSFQTLQCHSWYSIMAMSLIPLSWSTQSEAWLNFVPESTAITRLFRQKCKNEINLKKRLPIMFICVSWVQTCFGFSRENDWSGTQNKAFLRNEGAFAKLGLVACESNIATSKRQAAPFLEVWLFSVKTFEVCDMPYHAIDHLFDNESARKAVLQFCKNDSLEINENKLSFWKGWKQLWMTVFCPFGAALIDAYNYVARYSMKCSKGLTFSLKNVFKKKGSIPQQKARCLWELLFSAATNVLRYCHPCLKKNLDKTMETTLMLVLKRPFCRLVRLFIVWIMSTEAPPWVSRIL